LRRPKHSKIKVVASKEEEEDNRKLFQPLPSLILNYHTDYTKMSPRYFKNITMKHRKRTEPEPTALP
jgi:hypothetical protein